MLISIIIYGALSMMICYAKCLSILYIYSSLSPPPHISPSREVYLITFSTRVSTGDLTCRPLSALRRGTPDWLKFLARIFLFGGQSFMFPRSFLCVGKGNVETRNSSSSSVVLLSSCTFTCTWYSAMSSCRLDLKLRFLLLNVCIVVKLSSSGDLISCPARSFLSRRQELGRVAEFPGQKVTKSVLNMSWSTFIVVEEILREQSSSLASRSMSEDVILRQISRI